MVHVGAAIYNRLCRVTGRTDQGSRGDVLNTSMTLATLIARRSLGQMVHTRAAILVISKVFSMTTLTGPLRGHQELIGRAVNVAIHTTKTCAIHLRTCRRMMQIVG